MNMGIIIVITVLGIWALGVFLGVIGGLAKSFSHTPSAIDSSDVKTQAQESIDQTNDKQKQLMEDMQQKIQDQQSQKF